MRFRLAFYDTQEDNKFMAERRYEYLGGMDSIWQLWFLLTEKLGKRHVEVYNLAGNRCQPEKGIGGMIDYAF